MTIWRRSTVKPGRAPERNGVVMIEDAQGHRLSGATAASVGDSDQAVRAFNLVHGDAVGAFDAAREAAPDFVIAHLGKPWLLTMANDPGLLTQSVALVEATRSLT